MKLKCLAAVAAIVGLAGIGMFCGVNAAAAGMAAELNRGTVAGIAGSIDAAKPAAGGADGKLSGTEKSTADQEDKIYGIGSTSKVFTASAVMKLAEDGLLDLDLPLVDYIPEFYMDDVRYQKITPRMLLNHSSGLQGSSLGNTLLYGDVDTHHHDTLLEQLRSQRLKANPGEYTVYCNDGFTLAEILVERVGGQSFTEYMAQNFWEPMGLEHAGTSQSVTKNDNLASIYYRSGVELPYESANVIGSGGMYMTARDLSQAGQMFVDYPEKPFRVLSDSTVRRMNAPSYTDGYGLDPEVPAAFSYGLGWDSVESPAFSRYGIKAMSKGGDVSQYHTMLTVLPERNMSCAVVSSGGSSEYNSIVVQEIMLIYLEEMGQIERTGQSNEGVGSLTKELPAGFQDYTGWYTGSGVYQVSVSAEGTLLLASVGTKRDTVQEYTYIGDNRFVSEGGDYINSGGELVSAQAGIRGTTELTFCEENGAAYIGMLTTEVVPGLGEHVNNVTLAEKDEPFPVAAEVKSAWEARCDKEYLLVSEKYTSVNYLKSPSLRPMMFEGFEGYIGEVDGDFITKIVDADHTQFFKRIPGQFGRDVVDVEFYQKDGVEYMKGRHLYIDSAAAPQLTAGMSSVRVGSDGETSWYIAAEDMQEDAVKIFSPENGHFYIYTYVDDEMTCVASSMSGDQGKALYVPVGARVAFAGDAGAEFTIVKDE